MNRFIQYKKVMGLALAALTITACTDKWDDHYEAGLPAEVNAGTLWQALEQNPELSNFCRVAEATGFDRSLKGSQVFTVFAPTNANFSQQQADNVIALYKMQKYKAETLADAEAKEALYNDPGYTGTKDTLRDAINEAIVQFMQNHVARYTHSVAPTTSDSVVMMNGKYVVLTPQTFGGEQVLSSNKLYENGVLFTLDRPVAYTHNIFEYMRTDNSLDSLTAFFYSPHFYRYYLNERLSVAGGVIDGKTFYLDEVMNMENELFQFIGPINDEDSTYWMVAPTNAVWDSLVTEYSQYFNYNDVVDKRDSLLWAMPRFAIVEGTLFSRTRNTDAMLKDSAMSTNAVERDRRKRAWGREDLAYYQYEKPMEPGHVLDTMQTENVVCSNGLVFKTSKWNIDKQQTFMREIRVEAETATSLIDEKATNRNLGVRTVTKGNPFYGKVSDNRYLEVNGRNANSNPVIAFDIPDVLSNVGYDIYLVTVPAEALDTTFNATTQRPSSFHAFMVYKEQNGQSPDLRQATEEDLTQRNVKGVKDLEFFDTRAHVLDTLLLAEDFKFPTCAYGLSDGQVYLRLNSALSDATIDDEYNFDNYTNTLRIDCIVLRPHEATKE